ncbi:MAG TPA: T9SS type A sorting domain-containing protein [Rhodothermales bacterium]|nr:T9SS type A sorting domain-containing protein [Rhodothermales bacterium]
MKNLITILLLCFCALPVFAGYGFDGHNPTMATTIPSNSNMLQNTASGTASSIITGGSTATVYANFQYDTTGKSVYIVYTTNGTNPSKTNGTNSSCTFHNYTAPDRTWVCTLPSQSNGVTVKYVMYISDSTLSAAWGRLVTASTVQTGSWTEGDTAFSYTVQAPLSIAAITNFEATATNNSVALSWESRDPNITLSIQHSMNQKDWTDLGTIGSGLTNFTAKNVVVGTHYYRLKTIEQDFVSYSKTLAVMVEVPDQYIVYPAYPNPFNPQTTIGFATATQQFVHVEVFNAVGQKIQTLFQGIVEPNTLNQVSFKADGLSSGTYLVRILGTRFTHTQKLTLAK